MGCLFELDQCGLVFQGSLVRRLFYETFQIKSITENGQIIIINIYLKIPLGKEAVSQRCFLKMVFLGLQRF